MSEAAKLLLEFALFALPRVPALASTFFSFWDARVGTPLPPNVEAWRSIDAAIDARLAAERHDTPVPDTDPS